MTQIRIQQPMIISLILLGGLISGVFGQAAAPAVSAGPVNQLEVDNIRNKNLLNVKDQETLAKYIKEQFARMLQPKEAATLHTISSNLAEKSVIVNFKNEAAQQAYSDFFAGEVSNNFKLVYGQAAKLEDKIVAEQIQLAAAAVIAQADNQKLIKDLLSLLQNPSSKIVYLGAKGLTQANIRKSLLVLPTSDQNFQAVVKGLGTAVKAPDKPTQSNDMILATIAVAGAFPQDPASAALLKKIAQLRLEAYENWVMVGNELCDLDIIKQALGLVNKGVFANAAANADLVKTAADLYTAAFWRYVKGMEFNDTQKKTIVCVLSSYSQAQLPTVLIEGEREFLRISSSKLAPRMPVAVKPGTQRKTDLTRIYDALLGLNGPVNQAFRIYGAGADPKTSTLPDPPAPMVTRALAQSNTIQPESR